MIKKPNIYDVLDFLYDKIVKMYPRKPWKDSVKKLHEEYGEIIPIDILYENRIAYSLSLWDNYNKVQISDDYRKIVIDTFGYFLLYDNLYKDLDKRKQERLKKRFKHGFNNVSDLRALIFECYIYQLSKKLRYSVECKDDKSSGETYDFLIRKNDNTEVQVECKSFSYDKCLSISSNQAIIILEEVKDYISRNNYDLHREKKIELVIELGVIDFSNGKLKNEIITDIFTCIKEGKSIKNENYSIYNGENINDLTFDNKIELGLCVISNEFSLKIITNAKSILIERFEEICIKAIGQMKDDKPGVVAIHFSNSEMLQSLINNDIFKEKLNNLFVHRSILSIALFPEFIVNETNRFPFLSTACNFREYINENSKYKNYGKLFNPKTDYRT